MGVLRIAAYDTSAPESRQRLRRNDKIRREFGVWRSLVAHLLWEQGAGGSNPLTPTTFRLVPTARVCPFCVRQHRPGSFWLQPKSANGARRGVSPRSSNLLAVPVAASYGQCQGSSPTLLSVAPGRVPQRASPGGRPARGPKRSCDSLKLFWQKIFGATNSWLPKAEDQLAKKPSVWRSSQPCDLAGGLPANSGFDRKFLRLRLVVAKRGSVGSAVV